MKNISPLGSDLAYLLIAIIHFEIFYNLLGSLLIIYLIIILSRLIISQKRSVNPNKKTHIKFIDMIQERKTISGHIARLFSLTIALTYYYSAFYLFITPIIIFVAKERLHKKYHTKSDIIIGAITGVIAFYISFIFI